MVAIKAMALVARCWTVTVSCVLPQVICKFAYLRNSIAILVAPDLRNQFLPCAHSENDFTLNQSKFHHDGNRSDWVSSVTHEGACIKTTSDVYGDGNLPWSILARANYHRFFISDRMLFGLPNDMLLWGFLKQWTLVLHTLECVPVFSIAFLIATRT